MDHFNESNEYRTRKGIVHAKEDPIIIDFLCSNTSNEDKLLEVGGGSGAFLDLVLRNTSIRNVNNVEVVHKSYKNQVNENICLIGGNALHLPFKNVVVIKNLLHHLVGKTRGELGESKTFAKRSVDELTRFAKDKGYIIILDQYNKNKVFSFAIFYLTLFLSIFGVSFRSFGWHKNVIVSFLTPSETKSFLNENHDVEILFEQATRINVSKILKYTFLMSNIGRLMIIAKITKGPYTNYDAKKA